MVGPSPEADRLAARRKLKAGFVVLVGISAGSTTLQADVGPAVVLAATIVGLAVGVLLVWLAVPDGLDTSRDDR